jgi:hypothetical protein
MSGADTIEAERPDAPFDLGEGSGVVNVNGVPLADPALEARLLSVLIADPDCFGRVADHVFVEDFFDPLHRNMFAALHEGHEAGFAVGMSGMVKALGGDPNSVMSGGVTVSQFIAGMIADADTGADIEEMAVAIHECADRRANEAGTDSEILDREAPFVSKMGLRMWRDQNAPGPQYEYLIEDLIPERQCVLLIGDTQTGKSFLATHMSMCGVRAEPFFGRRVLQPFGVVWCAYEAAEGAPARMRAYRTHHNLGLDNLPFGALTRPLKLWPDPEMRNVNAVIEEIRGIEKSEFNGVRLGMVVIDTHNAGTPGASEIDSEVISKIRDHYHRIISATGATLLIVGHTNSAGKHRGNEQLSNNVDTIIRVSLKTKAVNAREVVQIKDDDKRDIRTMRVVKQREGQNGDEHDFILRVVEDGTKNKFGKPRTSCVVAVPNIADSMGDDGRDTDPNSRGGRFKEVSKQDALFLQCLLDATASDGIKPPAALNLPHSIRKVVDYDFVKKLMGQRMLQEEDNTPEGIKRHRERAKSANQRARHRLAAINVIGTNSPFIWWTGEPVRGVRATYPYQRDLLEAPSPEDSIDLGEWGSN